MNLLLAVVAHQHQVVGLGGATVLPFDDVMRHASFGRRSNEDRLAKSLQGSHRFDWLCRLPRLRTQLGQMGYSLSGRCRPQKRNQTVPLDLLSPHGAEELLRQNYIHQLRQTINAYLPAHIFVGEALQNALDAVRGGSPGNHRIHVCMDFDERTVAIQDSGPGFPDNPSFLFLGGGDKQDRGLAGMVGVGLKVVLFSSDRFTLQATNADKSLRVAVENAYLYSDSSPPVLELPDPTQFPEDPTPAISTGTGTLVHYRFPPGRNGSSGIPELFLRDVRDDCLVDIDSSPNFLDSIDNAAIANAYPTRLAALVASHLRRFSYLGSTVPRPEFDKLKVEITIRGSEGSLGDLAEYADGEGEVTFEVSPTYHTVSDALEWEKETPKPVIQALPLGAGGALLTKTKFGFNRIEYSTQDEWEELLDGAGGRKSDKLDLFREKLFPKLNSITLTIGRIPQFEKFCPGGSQRIISARGVVTQHSIEVSSGRNQQYVRCFDVVVEVNADLNYGKTLLTDMHLVSNVRKFINEAYRLTIQNACRNYVGTQRIEDRKPTPFWSRDRLGDSGSPLTIATVPYDENDVIALFFELAGMGVFKDFRWFGLSSKDTYDGRAVIGTQTDDTNLLDTAKETDLRTIEFKLRGASIARDFDREEKSIELVDLVICYEISDPPINTYQIVKWGKSTLNRNGAVPYPFVQNVLLDTVTGREVQILALQDVLAPDIIAQPPMLSGDAIDSD